MELINLVKAFLPDGFNPEKKHRKPGIREHLQQIDIVSYLNSYLR
jgi:hypothetical protein